MNVIPPEAVWHGPPTPKRVYEIQNREYIDGGDGWIYERQANGRYKRWHFIGDWKEYDSYGPLHQ